ncbi:peptidylprolyl isomerase fpr4, partial [Serendipita sp. 399]
LSKKAKKKLKALQAAAEKGDTATGPAAGSKDAEGPPQKKAKNVNGAAVPVDKNKKDTKQAAANATPKPKSAHPEGKQEKKSKEKEPEKEKGKGTEQPVKNDSIGKTKQLPGGLTITDKKAGSGAMAKKGSKIQVRYIGKLANGTVFDKNTSGKPFDFKLGAGEVIKGKF